MADEGHCIVVGLFLPLRCHRRGGELHRLANAHMARFAAVHDVGVRHIDLLDFGIPILSFSL